jgi:phthiocerol/phenolphthiocerol synthesis type-I polyketide synthase C
MSNKKVGDPASPFSNSNHPDDHSIAIVGMGFRLPGDLEDRDQLWASLMQGADLITEVPSWRWATRETVHPRRQEPGRSITYAAGVISGVDEFDPAFFGISPREAMMLDPQQRLLLELAWRAFEDAGHRPSRWAGSQMGVYVGISSYDYSVRSVEDLSILSPHSMIGNTLSLAANRLSYVYDLHGPSMAVDTACSSSLVALHQACQALRHGECPAAIAAGVSLLLHPFQFVGFTKASMLSANGRCKTFDESGDGYVRSEGGGVLLLRPLADALADGDRIHAVIRASGVNADGSRKTGITIPSIQGQIELMQTVLDRSGLKPDDLTFLEAHGTGTAVGDPVETQAVGTVYGQQRTVGPLLIGSVKANMGHLEAASGMAGLVKTIVALQKTELPPSLHLESPNSKIDFEGLGLQLIRQPHHLPVQEGRVPTAGINSFGFGGANAHVLLQSWPNAESAQSAFSPSPACPSILVLSARQPDVLVDMARQYAQLISDLPDQRAKALIPQVLYEKELMPHRLAVDLAAPHDAVEALSGFANQGSHPLVLKTETQEDARRIVFVYSGNGAQWAGMGQSLLVQDPDFFDRITQIDAIALPILGFSVLEQIQKPPHELGLERTEIAQPLLFVMQVVLTDWLASQHVQPDLVTGHSVGEIAAAWASGALSLEQALRVVAARSIAQGRTRGQGRMAAVGLSAVELQPLIDDLKLRVHIAAYNSPSSLTVAGPLGDLEHLGTRLPPKVFFKLLDLDYAFHSPFMDGLQSDIMERLSDLVPVQVPRVPMVSTVTGKVIDPSALTAQYWWKNIRQAVQFEKAIVASADPLARTLFVEIGPNAILQRYIRDSASGVGRSCQTIGTLRQGVDESLALHGALRQVVASSALRWRPQAKPVCVADLPGYPWKRQRYWIPVSSETVGVIHRYSVHPLLGAPVPESPDHWNAYIDLDLQPWLRDHQVGGAVVFPAAAYVEMILAVGRQIGIEGSLAIEDMDIQRPMVLEVEQCRQVRTSWDESLKQVRIQSRPRLTDDSWSLHVVAHLREATSPAATARLKAPSDGVVINAHNHYHNTASVGLHYGPAFQGVVQVTADEATFSGQLTDPLSAHEWLLSPALLDGALQSLASVLRSGSADNQPALRAWLPVRFRRLVRVTLGKVSQFAATIRRRSMRSIELDYELRSATGELLFLLQGMRFRSAPLASNAVQVPQWWTQVVPAPRETGSSALPAQALQPSALGRLLDASVEAVQPQRERWFNETQPLLQALASTFLQRVPVVEGHLHHRLAEWINSQKKVISSQGDLPDPQPFWQSLMAEQPELLDALLPLGRVGLVLPQVLQGAEQPALVHQGLQSAPMLENRIDAGVRYAAERQALGRYIQTLLTHQTPGQVLRVLEVVPSASRLALTGLEALESGAMKWTLVVPSAEQADRLKADWCEAHHVQVTHLPPDAVFDVVILRHALSSQPSPPEALRAWRRKLASGGCLVVSESGPDLSLDLVDCLAPDWSRVQRDPESWLALLRQEGLRDAWCWQEPAAQGFGTGVNLMFASSSPVSDQSSNRHSSSGQPWHLLADSSSQPLAQALANQLQAHGEAATVHRVGYVPSQSAHLVLMWGWESPADSAHVMLAQTLAVCQAQLSHGGKLWVITRGGALAEAVPGTVLPSPAQGSLFGLTRVLMNEWAGLAPVLIDLRDDRPHIQGLASTLLRELLEPDLEREVVLCSEARYGLRLRPHEAIRRHSVSPDTERCHLDFWVPGQFRHLEWMPDAVPALGPHEVEVQTAATGLNFRDVMYAMGLLPDEAVENGYAGASLGLEFSGKVSRVGSQVVGLKPGDPVMGFSSRGFATHVVVHQNALVPMPSAWSFEAAATVPTAFLTVYYALHHLAALQPGETVLIHGAAGGVGIAAIQVAKHLGAVVYATAGSEEKRALVRLMGADAVLDSRRLDFADQILELTSGEGVDVVLNSLAGEAMRRSVALLKPFGRFLELGKRDFFDNTALGLRPLRNNVSYHGIDADQLLNGRPDLAQRLFAEVRQAFEQGVFSPLPYQVFSASEVTQAFRTLQQARHVGKVVVRMPEVSRHVDAGRPSESQTLGGTWIVTGGLAGFGLACAQHLVDRGVRSLVLLGRRGLSTPGASQQVAQWRSAGIQVMAPACDVSDRDQLAHTLDSVTDGLPPVQGIVHAAMVLDDRIAQRLDGPALQRVLAPKLTGAQHLHALSKKWPIQHFVLFSSITTALGNPGQGNYVAANAGLEALVARRRRQGLPAVCLAWGPLADVGYLTEHQAVLQTLQQRLGRPPLQSAQALAVFDQALIDPLPVVRFVADVDWQVTAKSMPAQHAPRFEWVMRQGGGQAVSGETPDELRQMLLSCAPEQALVMVQKRVMADVAQVLLVSEARLKPTDVLHDLGLDSLMAVELALALEKRFGVSLPSMVLNEAQNIERLSMRLLEMATGHASPEGSEGGHLQHLLANVAGQHGETFTQEQFEAVAKEAIEKVKQGVKWS